MAAVVDVREVRIPRAMKHQEPLLKADARFKIACNGRRWGKTVVGLKSVLEGHGPRNRKGVPRYKGALHGGNIWWVAPTYKIAQPIWRALKAATRDAWVEKSEVDRRIVLPGGGSVTVRSADDPDSLRGAGLDGMVVDEAAMLKADAWGQALRPALADRQGWAILISTPKGMNWFAREFDRAAERADYKRWQRPSWDNPLMTPDEIDALRRVMGPLEFAQEVEAQFVVAGRGMFKPEWRRYWHTSGAYLPNLGLDGLDSVTLLPGLETPNETPRSLPVAGLRRFATVDLATSTKTSADYTVISAWGASSDADLIALEVIRERMEGPDIIPTLEEVVRRWRLSFVGIEAAGMQLALVQQAVRAGLPAKELRAGSDKVTRAMTATARCQAGKVFLPEAADDLHDLESEMLSFPEGEHDDFVDTLAYACIELTSVNMEPAIAPTGMGRESPWRIS